MVAGAVPVPGMAVSQGTSEAMLKAKVPAPVFSIYATVGDGFAPPCVAGRIQPEVHFRVRDPSCGAQHNERP
jgi:hypothetical protein